MIKYILQLIYIESMTFWKKLLIIACIGIASITVTSCGGGYYDSDYSNDYQYEEPYYEDYQNYEPYYDDYYDYEQDYDDYYDYDPYYDDYYDYYDYEPNYP